MYQNRWSVVFFLANLAAASIAQATSLVPGASERQIRTAGAIFRGQVLAVSSFRRPGDGHIYTRAILQVKEVFKGQAPQVVYLINLGGAVDGMGEDTGLDPRFMAGEERLVFVTRDSEGGLCTPLGQLSSLPLPSGELLSGNATDPIYAAGLGRLEELRTPAGVVTR